MAEDTYGVCTYCRKTTSYSTWSRQCFMTGEQCSKQSVVHKERERLHAKNEINAFVVMNFSNMSDVVYKWKLSSFIESLKDYLYLNKADNLIVCVADKDHKPDFIENDTDKKGEKKWTQVDKIHVIRADSNTASNYIICNRVCQQMQIADLVIVDVSVENTNVFYEFGMAAAFGKLILPICYNESFYYYHIPDGAKERLDKMRQLCEKEPTPGHIMDLENFRKMVEHHIDCYPWRRKLFEYYGIRYRNEHSEVGYTIFEDIVNPLYGYSDTQYNRFPYDAMIDRKTGEPLKNEKKDKTAAAKDPHKNEGEQKNEDAQKEPEAPSEQSKAVPERVGTLLYSRLSDSYGRNTTSGEYNTVVIYTMDSLLNGKEAGQCIINFYQNMTSQIWEEFCFCGDRVGIMGQANAVHDDPKDTKTNQKLFYRVGDVIRIGMNEATHQAQKHRIKTGDYLLGTREIVPKNEEPLDSDDEWRNKALRFTKGHVRNRCIPIYPDEPIYVQELLHGVQKGILSDDMLEKKKYDYRHFFCLFHVTLHTLRYTNEIVVDLSQNSLQALFWLGVAHGRNAQAITVRHAPTEEELRHAGVSELPAERNIFDVAGLWTAILHSNNTEGFYNQLAMTQIGIEQHHKLTLQKTDTEHDQEKVLDEFYEASPYMKFGYEGLLRRIEDLDKRQQNEDHTKEEKLALYDELRAMLKHLYKNQRMRSIWQTLSGRNRKESERLESYYRTLFWKRMLRYNELQLYTPQHRGHDTVTQEPKRVSITWDMDTAAELSHYLSKRTTIGRYRIRALQENELRDEARNGNFICLGGKTVPMKSTDGKALPLVQHIRTNIRADGDQNIVHHLADCECECKFSRKDKNDRSYRGFFSEDGTHNVFAQFASAYCTGNMEPDQENKTKTACKKFSEGESTDYAPIKMHFEQVALDDDAWKVTGKGSFRLIEDPPLSCELCKNKAAKYDQLAQMLLWREVPENPTDQREKVRYWGSLIGVSGPSTLALASLLVDDQQKRDMFGWPSEKKKAAALPLNDLQTHVRKTLMAHYDKVLKELLPEEHFTRASHATKLYLSTVLYQYFFPFLSKADEIRICNGMSAYVTSSGFMDLFEVEEKTYQDIVTAVTKALENTLYCLRGVEVLYRVEVEDGIQGKDDRKPRDIHLLRRDKDAPGDGKGEPMISCLFTDPPAK